LNIYGHDVDDRRIRCRRAAGQIPAGAGAPARARAAEALERGKVFVNDREVTLADAARG
jgi:hypothetical protein